MRVRRVRKAKPGEVKVQWGTLPDGETPRGGDLVFSWGDGCGKWDGSLLFSYLTNARLSPTGWDTGKSLLDELKERGYDLTTLTFSVRKPQPQEPADG